MLCSCLPWILASSPVVAAAAAVLESPRTEFSFDIPATTLDEALTRFTEQSGFSVGMAGTLPRLQTPRVSGRLGAQQALQQLLSGSGLVAVPRGAVRLPPRTAHAAGTNRVPRDNPRSSTTWMKWW